MADEGNADTFEYPINGRVFTLRKMTSSRITVLERYWNAMQAKGEAAATAEEKLAIDKKMANAVWEMIESQFIDPADLEFVQLEIVMGRLSEADLGPIMANGETRAKPLDDDEDPVPVKKPGRKAASKKAATRANPSRAKR